MSCPATVSFINSEESSFYHKKRNLKTQSMYYHNVLLLNQCLWIINYHKVCFAVEIISIVSFSYPCIFFLYFQTIHFLKCTSLCIRYHYYGIAVKENSQYYDVMYSKKGAAWVNETGKKEVTKQTVAYSPRSKLGTLLPEFPNVKDLNLPASLPEEKVTLWKYFLGLSCFFCCCWFFSPALDEDFI